MKRRGEGAADGWARAYGTGTNFGIGPRLLGPCTFLPFLRLYPWVLPPSILNFFQFSRPCACLYFLLFLFSMSSLGCERRNAVVARTLLAGDWPGTGLRPSERFSWGSFRNSKREQELRTASSKNASFQWLNFLIAKVLKLKIRLPWINLWKNFEKEYMT